MKPVKHLGHRIPSLPAMLLALLLVLSACGAPDPGQAPLPTATSIPAAPTNTPASKPTDTAVPAAPTNTVAPPTNTAVPPTATIVPEAPTVTPATPTNPPDTTTGEPADIVFVHDGGLALVNADGLGLRTLTEPRSSISSPRWSPDKTRIAYVRGAGSNAQLFVTDLAGNATVLQTEQGLGAVDPQWSPDGRTIAYVQAADVDNNGIINEADSPEVWLIDADGGNARRLADGFDPAWAPDGKRIAFVTAGSAEAGNTIDMINSEGKNRWTPIKISQIPQDTSVMNPDAQFNAGTNYLRYPEWAPSNRAIAFNAFGHSGLIVTATDKGAEITPRDFQYEGGFRRVHWSPDGQKLVYEGLPPSGINQVKVLGLDGTTHVVFGDPRTMVNASSPTWSPDSRQIAFVQYTAEDSPTAYDDIPVGALVVSAIGGLGEARTIVEAGAAEPDWR